MGLVPLAVMWIFITWWIVLFGLQLTFATQHLKTLDAAEISSMHKSDQFFVVNDFTVIRILGFILEQFEKKQAPVSAEVICGKLDLPAEFGEKILDHLVAEKLLLCTSEPLVGFAPATDGANITLAEIADAVANASFAQQREEIPSGLKAVIDAQHDALSRCTLKQALEKTINSQAPAN